MLGIVDPPGMSIPCGTIRLCTKAPNCGPLQSRPNTRPRAHLRSRHLLIAPATPSNTLVPRHLTVQQWPLTWTKARAQPPLRVPVPVIRRKRTDKVPVPKSRFTPSRKVVVSRTPFPPLKEGVQRESRIVARGDLTRRRSVPLQNRAVQLEQRTVSRGHLEAQGKGDRNDEPIHSDHP